jgi:hypothetical protein
MPEPTREQVAALGRKVQAMDRDELFTFAKGLADSLVEAMIREYPDLAFKDPPATGLFCKRYVLAHLGGAVAVAKFEEEWKQ